MEPRFIRSIKIEHDKIDQYSYLNKIEAIKNLDELIFDSAITFFVGENGSGKSTLLEAIAIALGFNPEGGSKNYRFNTYDSHSDLYKAIKTIRTFNKEKFGYFLRAESFYNVATKEEEYADKPSLSKHYHQKSHGESFLELLNNNLTENGLYLIDELEAALSAQRQLSALIEIYESAKMGSQFIIVTHSPILLAIPNATIYSFDGDNIHKINYEESDAYQITKMFIENKDDILRRLLESEGI